MVTDRLDIDAAATILAAADRTRYLTARLQAEMFSELRWPGDPDPDTGIDVCSLELDPGDYAVMGILRRPEVMAHLAEWNAGSALGDDTRDRVQAGSGLAVVPVAGHELADFVRGGSAMEAVWITAQQHGLAVQPISPVFLYARTPEELNELSGTFCDELATLQSQFRALVGTEPDAAQILVAPGQQRADIGQEPQRHESFAFALKFTLATVGACRAASKRSSPRSRQN